MRDLRKFARQTQNRLVAGLLILVSTIGIVLIYILYGKEAALLGLICLAGVLIPVLLILFVLYLIERIAKHDRS